MADMHAKEPAPKRHRSESRQRRNDIHVRANDDEYAQMLRYAKAVGLSLSSYLRDAGLKRRFTKGSPHALASVISRLGTVVEILVALQRELPNVAHKNVIDEVLREIRSGSDALVSDLI